MDFFMFFCIVFAMPLCASVYMCLVVTCWKRADLLALVCHFPVGILGQVRYLIVSIPDLCNLTYFYFEFYDIYNFVLITWQLKTSFCC